MAAHMDADVIIAGAGIAGATMALALNQAGLKAILIDPVVFDAQVAPTFDGRSSAIAYAAFRQWKALGLAADLEPHAQRIEQILVTDGHDPGRGVERADAVLPALRLSRDRRFRSDGEPLGYLLENRHIRAALAQGRAGDAGIDGAGARPRSPSRGLRIRPRSAVDVWIRWPRSLHAPLVVGAEGRGSVIRTAAGIGVVGWDYPQTGVVATVRLDRPHEGVAHEYFLPGGPVRHPAADRRPNCRASLVWTESTRAGRGAESRPAGDLPRPPACAGSATFLGEVTVEGPVFTYPLSLQLAERFVAPRAALLGDAAHGVHPIAGQGLNLGLKGAAALAEVIVEACRLGEDFGSEVVLERYAAWRRFDTITLSAGMDAFVRLFSNDNLASCGWHAARAWPPSTSIGPARRFFMTEAGGAVGDLPRLLKGEAL